MHCRKLTCTDGQTTKQLLKHPIIACSLLHPLQLSVSTENVQNGSLKPQRDKKASQWKPSNFSRTSQDAGMLPAILLYTEKCFPISSARRCLFLSDGDTYSGSDLCNSFQMYWVASWISWRNVLGCPLLHVSSRTPITSMTTTVGMQCLDYSEKLWNLHSNSNKVLVVQIKVCIWSRQYLCKAL